MFRVHHGLQDFVDVTDIAGALAVVRRMLETGRTNVVITRPGTEITGELDCDDKRETASIGTLKLEIPIYP